MTIGPRIQCQLHAPKESLTGRPRWSPFMFYDRAMQLWDARLHFRAIELAKEEAATSNDGTPTWEG